MRTKIAPSILASDFSRLGETVALLEESGADLIHCDVMDGNFVPPITFGAQAVRAMRPHTKLPLDCHLMVLHPETHIPAFVDAGADIISVHVEVCGEDTPRVLRSIQKSGVKACAVINPETEVEKLFPAAEVADMLLVMSVHPGRGGQEFLRGSLEKIAALRRFCQKIGRGETDIEVDGGICLENAEEVLRAGANVLVAGSYIFSAPSLASAIASLRK